MNPNKLNQIKKKRKLTSVVGGKGKVENPSSISLLEPKPVVGIEVSNPLVSSFRIKP